MRHLVVLLFVFLACQMTAVCSEELEAHARVVEGNNAFSRSLYQVLKGTPGNIVVSPFSVLAAFGMLLQGLQGGTAKRVSTALHLPEDLSVVGQGFKALLQSLQNSENVTLEIANKIYLEKHFHIEEKFLQDTENYFQSISEKLDIRGNPNAVVPIVNDWAAEKTHDKIKDILVEGDVTVDTIMIILNAIYFKGLWATAFDKQWTKDETFHLSTSSRKNVPMMHLTAELAHANFHDQNMQVLKLPYIGGKYSMLILLPNDIDGLQKLEDNFHTTNFSLLRTSLWPKEVILTMPRFKILKKIDLLEPLIKLGMGELFNGTGNFSGINDEEQLAVSKVLQKAFIEVNEEGTEAAAVTVVGVAVITSVGVQPIPTYFTVDRPFLYMITDEERGAILFLGRVTDPAE